MNEVESQNSVKELLEQMVEAKQLSAMDAENLARQSRSGSPSLRSEEEVLRWLATEYNISYTSLDDVEPDRQLLSLFPARLLLKDRTPSPDVFPSEHILRLRAAAEAKFADKLAGVPRS